MTGGPATDAVMRRSVHRASSWPRGGTEFRRLRCAFTRASAYQRKGEALGIREDDIEGAVFRLRTLPVSTGGA